MMKMMNTSKNYMHFHYFKKLLLYYSITIFYIYFCRHEETVLRPRTFYKKLNIPTLGTIAQSENIVDSVMSSDSDTDVEQPRSTFKDEVNLNYYLLCVMYSRILRKNKYSL